MGKVIIYKKTVACAILSIVIIAHLNFPQYFPFKIKDFDDVMLYFYFYFGLQLIGMLLIGLVFRDLGKDVKTMDRFSVFLNILFVIPMLIVALRGLNELTQISVMPQ